MKSLFKRLNENGRVGLIVGFAVITTLLPACKKKEKLTNSTYNFSISPAASAVAKGETLTLRARGAGELNPTWSVSASTLGTVSPEVGPVVVFTPNATTSVLGDLVITAIFDGQMATSQIAVVTYKPNSNTFDVYTDQLPSGVSATINLTGGITLTEPISGYTPQGTKFLRMNGMDVGQNLQVIMSAQNLSDFAAGGTLKFAMRLGQAIPGVAETFQIDLIGGGTQSYDLIRNTDFSPSNLDWQEISISLPANFGGLDYSQVTSPFTIIGQGLSGPIQLDIDAVRWEK